LEYRRHSSAHDSILKAADRKHTPTPGGKTS